MDYGLPDPEDVKAAKELAEKTERDRVRKEKSAELSKLVREAQEALTKAEEFADEYGLEFSFSPAYGMGGTYVSEQVAAEWESSSGWQASSQGC